jgi:hypothetical protein
MAIGGSADGRIRVLAAATSLSVVANGSNRSASLSPPRCW